MTPGEKISEISRLMFPRLYIYGGQDLNVGIFSDFNYIQLNKELTLSCWEPVYVNGTVTPGKMLLWDSADLIIRPFVSNGNSA